MFIHCLKGRTPFLVGYSSGLRGRFALLFTSGFLLARSLILKVSGRGRSTARDSHMHSARRTARRSARLTARRSAQLELLSAMSLLHAVTTAGFVQDLSTTR